MLPLYVLYTIYIPTSNSPYLITPFDLAYVKLPVFDNSLFDLALSFDSALYCQLDVLVKEYTCMIFLS